MNNFEKIMLSKFLKEATTAANNKDLPQLERLVKQNKTLIGNMEKQERTEFNAQLKQLNAQFDQVDDAINIISDSIDRISPVDSDEVDALMQQVMQDAAKKHSQSMPNVPTGFSPRKTNQQQGPTSQGSQPPSLEEHKRFASDIRKDSTTGSSTPKSPQQRTTPEQHRQARRLQLQQQQQQLKADNAVRLAAFEAKTEKALKTAQDAQNFMQKGEAEFKASTPAKKESSLHDAMKDAKNNFKNAYKAIGKLLNKIYEAIKKAPEQEKKLNASDRKIIEQSAEQLTKPGVTPEQAFAHTGTILNQVEKPSGPEAGSTQETIAPEQGWLTRALDKASEALTTLKSTLGFKSAKEDLQEAINDIDVNATNSDTNTSEKLDLSEEQEQKPESPGSGLQ